jgi:hypothetical protein
MLFRALFAPERAWRKPKKSAEITCDSLENRSQNHAIPGKKYYIESARISLLAASRKTSLSGSVAQQK